MVTLSPISIQFLVRFRHQVGLLGGDATFNGAAPLTLRSASDRRGFEGAGEVGRHLPDDLGVRPGALRHSIAGAYRRGKSSSAAGRNAACAAYPCRWAWSRGSKGRDTWSCRICTPHRMAASGDHVRGWRPLSAHPWRIIAWFAGVYAKARGDVLGAMQVFGEIVVLLVLTSSL